MRRSRLPRLIQNEWNVNNSLYGNAHRSRALNRFVSTPFTPSSLPKSLVANWDVGVPFSLSNGKLLNLCKYPADGSAASAYDFYLGSDGTAEVEDPAPLWQD